MAIRFFVLLSCLVYGIVAHPYRSNLHEAAVLGPVPAAHPHYHGIPAVGVGAVSPISSGYHHGGLIVENHLAGHQNVHHYPSLGHHSQPHLLGPHTQGHLIGHYAHGPVLNHHAQGYLVVPHAQGHLVGHHAHGHVLGHHTYGQAIGHHVGAPIAIGHHHAISAYHHAIPAAVAPGYHGKVLHAPY